MFLESHEMRQISVIDQYYSEHLIIIVLVQWKKNEWYIFIDWNTIDKLHLCLLIIWEIGLLATHCSIYSWAIYSVPIVTSSMAIYRQRWKPLKNHWIYLKPGKAYNTQNDKWKFEQVSAPDGAEFENTIK